MENKKIKMQINSVKLLAKYPRINLKQDELTFEVEKDWEVRPAWIKLINIEGSFPRFLSVQVPKFGELIYKSFGAYYFPFDYTNDEELRLMNGMAKDYDDMVGRKFNIPMAKALLDKVPLGELSPESHILDLGCGTGIISALLAVQGYRHFTLVDFSRGMLNAAKTKPRLRNAHFILADVIKELPGGRYDLVVSVMLLNTFDEKSTDNIVSRLIPRLNPNSIFATLEDTQKHSYQKYFEPIYENMVDVANRTKYVFVGKLK